MRVRFKMDGGFVYLPARSEPTTIDTDDLPAEEAKELQRLIEAAGFFELPEILHAPRGGGLCLHYLSQRWREQPHGSPDRPY